MLRRSFGFDMALNSGHDLQWDLIAGTWYNFSAAQVTGKPGPFGSGPPGQAVYKWFGSMLATAVFDPQTSWAVGFDWQRPHGGGPTAANKQVMLSDATGVILAFETEADGTMNIRVGGTTASSTGTIVASTVLPVAIPVGQWAGYTELKATGFGGTIVFELWMDDALIMNGTTSLGARIPDRVTLAVQADNGRYFDNVYVTDGQGAAPWNDRLGPIYIQSFLAAADWRPQLARNAGTSNVGRYLDNGGTQPDGDFSYTFGSGLFDLYSLVEQPCFGRILGLSVNMCARSVSGSPQLQLVAQSDPFNPTVLPIGAVFLPGPSYHTFQTILQASPNSGGFWNDKELGAAYFGQSVSSAGVARVTQMFFEKIVSLRNVPYDCGSASYSY